MGDISLPVLVNYILSNVGICCKVNFAWIKRFQFSLAVLDPLPNGQDAKDYLARSVNPTLQRGLAELCRQKPAEPIVSIVSLYFLHIR